MGLIAFCVLGLIAGAIAKTILPGKQPGGIIVTMLVGVLGALVAGWLAGVVFNSDPLDEFFDCSTWITAILGAAGLLGLWGLISKRM